MASLMNATAPVKPETAREFKAWCDDLRSCRDQIVKDGCRTEVIGRIFVALFGHEYSVTFPDNDKLATAEARFTSPEKCPPWFREELTRLMTEAMAPAPVVDP